MKDFFGRLGARLRITDEAVIIPALRGLAEPFGTDQHLH